MKEATDNSSDKGRRSTLAGRGLFRIILINLMIAACVLAALEVAARIAVYALRGKSTIGTPQRLRYLHYQPFVMYGPDWDSAVSSRLRVPPGKDGRACRILLLGGSTAAGFPSDTLAGAFSARFPTCTFEVLNAAVGGYNARQELVVAALWGPQLEPDIIITLDGANDLEHRLRTDKAGTFYLNPDYELSLKHPFLSPFAHLLRHSQAFQGMKRLMARHQVGPPDEYEDAIPVYVSAQHSINVLAKGLSAARVMVLQPHMAFKKPLSQAEAGFTWYKYREPVIKELFNRTAAKLADLAARDGVIYLDGRSVFDGIPETIFSDDVHFVDQRGYELTAKAMASKLRGSGWKPASQ